MKILNMLLNTKKSEVEPDEMKHFHHLIAGYLMILDRILEIEPSLKRQVAENDKGLIKRIFTECLFETNSHEEKEIGGVLCTNSVTREPAYKFLVNLCTDMTNKGALLENGLVDLCKKLPVVSGWTYRPAFDKRH